MTIGNIRVGVPRIPDTRHKRLSFTSQEWAALLAVSGVQVPGPVQPKGLESGSANSDDGDSAREGAIGSLRAMGVLTDETDPRPVPEVERSLALLAGSSIALHITVGARALGREAWWALDTQRAVGVYLRADSGVDWVTCAAQAMSAHLPAVVLSPAALEVSSESITAALTGEQPGEACPREQFSVPLSMLTRPDPLASAAASPTPDEQHLLGKANGLRAGATGSLTARVYSQGTGSDQTSRLGVGEHLWLATADGWWSITRRPRPATDSAPVGAGPWARVTPVEPADLPATVAPLLTHAFELAAGGQRASAAPQQRSSPPNPGSSA